MSGLAGRLAAPLLLLLAFAMPLAFSTRKSVTLDEVAHIPAGYSYLRTGEIVLNPMHPPLLKEIYALPLLFLSPKMPEDAATIRLLGKDITYQWEFGQQFLSGPDLHRIVQVARIPAVLLSACLALLIFVWARELWGLPGGLAALLLYVFDPTITAHAQLVTTDVGFAFLATVFVFTLRRYLLAPGSRRILLAGVVLGLAFGAKFSAAALPPIALLLTGQAILQAPVATRAVRARELIRGLFAICAIGAVVLWSIYLFPADPTFYARGLGSVQGDYDPRYAHYLMGEFRAGRWLHYFLVAWLVKTPIPAILAVLLAGVLFLRGRRVSWFEEACLLLPAGVLFAGYCLGAKALGIRYIIPCYPFLFVFTGRIGPWFASLGRTGAALAAALALWYVIEFVAIAPDHLSYFNQIAGGSSGGLAWLDDSNVDWGQGLVQLHDYLEEHPIDGYHLCYHPGVDPTLYGIHGEIVWIEDLLAPPSPGVLILSGHCVARIRAWLALQHGNGPENWLATARPKAIVGHAYYIYEIPEATAR